MIEKDKVRQTFSKNKEAYITSSIHAKGSDLLQLTKWLNPEQHMIALDIATGGGHVAKQLAPFVQHIYATDITIEMLENTASHLDEYDNIHYIVADAEQLPFIDNRFDFVTCRIAAHHFPQPDKFIKEVSRVLKPGGSFLFIDNIASEKCSYHSFINTLEKMRDPSHVRSLKLSEWRNFLKENKLAIIKERTKKKTLPYDEWVNRTLTKETEIEQVSQFILNAPRDIQEYHQVNVINETIQSFSIDEWMVLCEK